MRIKLRQEEEVLASGETPPKGCLLEMIEDLLGEVDDGGLILECSFEDIELEQVTL